MYNWFILKPAEDKDGSQFCNCHEEICTILNYLEILVIIVVKELGLGLNYEGGVQDVQITRKCYGF